MQRNAGKLADLRDVMKRSHDHFGNLHRTSRMPTENDATQNESHIKNRQNL